MGLEVAAENGVDLSQITLGDRTSPLPVPLSNDAPTPHFLGSRAGEQVRENLRKRLHGGLLLTCRVGILVGSLPNAGFGVR
jgi:hypothetical protein